MRLISTIHTLTLICIIPNTFSARFVNGISIKSYDSIIPPSHHNDFQILKRLEQQVNQQQIQSQPQPTTSTSQFQYYQQSSKLRLLLLWPSATAVTTSERLSSFRDSISHLIPAQIVYERLIYLSAVGVERVLQNTYRKETLRYIYGTSEIQRDPTRDESRALSKTMSGAQTFVYPPRHIVENFGNRGDRYGSVVKEDNLGLYLVEKGSESDDSDSESDSQDIDKNTTHGQQLELDYDIKPTSIDSKLSSNQNSEYLKSRLESLDHELLPSIYFPYRRRKIQKFGRPTTPAHLFVIAMDSSNTNSSDNSENHYDFTRLRQFKRYIRDKLYNWGEPYPGNDVLLNDTQPVKPLHIYGNILHVSDDSDQEALDLGRLLLNPNSIHWLNRAGRGGLGEGCMGLVEKQQRQQIRDKNDNDNSVIMIREIHDTLVAYGLIADGSKIYEESDPDSSELELLSDVLKEIRDNIKEGLFISDLNSDDAFDYGFCFHRRFMSLRLVQRKLKTFLTHINEVLVELKDRSKNSQKLISDTITTRLKHNDSIKISDSGSNSDTFKLLMFVLSYVLQCWFWKTTHALRGYNYSMLHDFQSDSEISGLFIRPESQSILEKFETRSFNGTDASLAFDMQNLLRSCDLSCAQSLLKNTVEILEKDSHRSYTLVYGIFDL